MTQATEGFYEVSADWLKACGLGNGEQRIGPAAADGVGAMPTRAWGIRVRLRLRR
jgi:hypothetical protein